MKVGFIGLGRMGSAMTRRLIEGGHEVGLYNRTPEKLKDLIALGAKPLDAIAAAANYGEAVFTMLADDAAVTDVVSRSGGLLASLPKGGIHICAGTHSVACIKALKAGGFAKLGSPFFDLFRESADFGVICDHALIVVLFVNIASIRAHKLLLQGSKIAFVLDEPENHGLQSSRSRVVLFIRVGRRGDHGID